MWWKNDNDPKDYKVQYEDMNSGIFHVEYGTFTLTAAQRYCERANASYAGKRDYTYFNLTEED